MAISSFRGPDDPFESSQERRHAGIPRESRVFVNRNLRMQSIGAVGFDLDYTLANYAMNEIDELAFRLTKEKLVEKCGHPEEILKIPYDPEFVVRGLVIDRRRGNILKMDYHNYVARAYHGRRQLTTEERKAAYLLRRVRTSGDAYVSVDTLFHLPEVYLYLSLVDFYEARDGGCRYRDLYQDVRNMIDQAHADGSIKREIGEHPARFITKSPQLARFLRTLRAAGKKLFLLTNSEGYYTDLVLSFLLHEPGAPHWREYFDFVSVDARKPKFFQKKGLPGEAVATEGPGAPVFSGGDVWQLEQELGFAGGAILYWGDHTYGDILRSKKSVGWRTAMIIPELEEEIRTTQRIAPDLMRLEEALEVRDGIHEQTQALKLELRRIRDRLAEGSLDEREERALKGESEKLRVQLNAIQREGARQRRQVASLDDTCNLAYNRYWGMLFREANQITRFAHQVRDFACIYTSKVSNFLNYPMNTYFRTPSARMPHER